MPSPLLDHPSKLSILRSRDYKKVVVVTCSSTVPAQHRRLVTKSLSLAQFIFAQFYHPGEVAEYETIFVR